MKYEPKELKTLTADPQVVSARLTPCGKFLLAGSHDGRLRRWDVGDPAAEPKEIEPYSGHGGWIGPLVFKAEGEILYSGDSWGQLRCWDYAAETSPVPKWAVKEAHDGWLREIWQNADGSLLATCGTDRMARIWSAVDGAKKQELKHEQDVRCVRFHPDGKHLVTGDDRGTIRVFEIESGKLARSFGNEELYKLDRLQDVGGVWCMSLDAVGKLLVVGGMIPKNGATTQGTPVVQLWDYEAGTLTKTIKLGGDADCFVHDLAFHPDGFLMVVTCGSPGQGKIVFLRPDDAEPFFTSTKLANCQSLSLHAPTRRLAVMSTNRGSNLNGRAVDKEGKYVANQSPITFFELPG